jgi:hypothetical protein
MADVICNGGLVAIAGALQSYLNALTLHLYTTNITPAFGDTASTYLPHEASFPGYSPISINSWGTAFLSGSNLAEIDEQIRVFTLSTSGGPYPIYGYFILDGSSNLIWAGLNSAAPVNLANAGDTYSVQPKYQEKNC